MQPASNPAPAAERKQPVERKFKLEIDVSEFTPVNLYLRDDLFTLVSEDEKISANMTINCDGKALVLQVNKRQFVINIVTIAEQIIGQVVAEVPKGEPSDS